MTVYLKNYDPARMHFAAANVDASTGAHGGMTENRKPFQIVAVPTDLTHGCRQGAIYLEMQRTSSYAMTSSDGNPDCGLKMIIRNRSASSSYCRTRAMDVLAEIRDSGAGSVYVQGLYLTAKTRSGTTVTDVNVAQFNIDHGATGTGDITGLIINDASQSATGTMYGVKVYGSSYSITREYAFHVDSGGGSWTNGLSLNGTVTNVLDFENSNGTNGATTGTSLKDSDAADIKCDGYLKIDVASTSYYIPIYDTLNS